MNKTFEQEWNLYKAGGKRPSFAGEAPRGNAEFDSPVKVGEIRIFEGGVIERIDLLGF